MIQLTAKERKAILFLSLILTTALLIQWLLPNKLQSKQYDYTMQDSIFKALSDDTVRTIEPGQKLQKELKTKPKKSSKKELQAKSINVNTASKSELQKLPRIGPKTAQAIIDYRQENGLFTKAEQLTKVKRIGPKTLEKILPYLILEPDSVKIK